MDKKDAEIATNVIGTALTLVGQQAQNSNLKKTLGLVIDQKVGEYATSSTLKHILGPVVGHMATGTAIHAAKKLPKLMKFLVEATPQGAYNKGMEAGIRAGRETFLNTVALNLGKANFFEVAGLLREVILANPSTAMVYRVSQIGIGATLIYGGFKGFGTLSEVIANRRFIFSSLEKANNLLLEKSVSKSLTPSQYRRLFEELNRMRDHSKIQEFMLKIANNDLT